MILSPIFRGGRKIIQKFYNRVNTRNFENKYLMGTIRSKLLLNNTVCTKWKDIKTVLKNYYLVNIPIYIKFRNGRVKTNR